MATHVASATGSCPDIAKARTLCAAPVCTRRVDSTLDDDVLLPRARHRSCALQGESGQLPVAEGARMSSSRPRHAAQRQLELEARARHRRQHATLTEQRLWSALKGSRLGVPFRRQVVIGRYIADLVCPRARLVVEVDGGVHEARARLDAHRDSVLQHAGYRVLRIPAALVTSNLEAAVALVRHALRA
jgi:very-short-patch-repair endonuclease